MTVQHDTQEPDLRSILQAQYDNLAATLRRPNNMIQYRRSNSAPTPLIQSLESRLLFALVASAPAPNRASDLIATVRSATPQIAQPPTAALTAATLSASQLNFSIVVTFTGQNAIDVSSLNRKDIFVIAPDATRPMVLLGNTVSSNQGKTLAVTYFLRTSSGHWTSANNGIYRVYVHGNEVRDDAGNFVAAGFIGHIHVSITNPPTSPIVAGNITVKLVPVVTLDTTTVSTPQDLTSAPDGSGRIFIATRTGDILILKNGKLLAKPFLDMAADGINIYDGGEGGFLGLAFSPNYAIDGKFYTIDTEPFSQSGPAADFSSPELFPTTSVDPNNQIVIREWRVDPHDPNFTAPNSRVLLRIDHPQSNHQGGSLRFGPDGDLYIGLGDGGGANDRNGPANDPTDGHNNAVGNAQDLSVPFGKILRINPDPTPRAGFIVSANGQYTIPDDNPFVGKAGDLAEIYAYGLRNPYRMGFDSTTGKLYVGDVGQDQREEVDLITSGGNYGWPFFEGTRNNTADAGRPLPAGFTSIAPIAEYTHGDGHAIIGGTVYRGSAISALDGQYVFGDYSGTNGTARLFYTSAAGGTISELKYSSAGVTPSAQLYAFGTDASGNMYALFSSGQILEIE
jgi:glucose/arabinose dehydrogenase